MKKKGSHTRCKVQELTVIHKSIYLNIPLLQVRTKASSITYSREAPPFSKTLVALLCHPNSFRRFSLPNNGSSFGATGYRRRRNPKQEVSAQWLFLYAKLIPPSPSPSPPPLLN